MSSVSNRFNLTGRTAVVTGAASGIGRATAVSLAGLGARVVIADVASAKAEEAAAGVRAAGGEAVAIAADVTSREQVQQMVDQAVQKFGRVDILVNNAGIMAYSGVMDMQEAELEKALNVNLMSVMLCSQAAGKYMVQQQSGRIVNIGSSFSSRASVCNISGGGAGYCASKAAVQALTRSLAMEMGPHGITVNAVAPGITNTPMHTGLWEGAVIYYQGSVPLGRLAEPEDIADVVAFLATDAARYITGQTIHVNGGQIMVD